MDGKTEFPQDIGPMEGGRFNFLWGLSLFTLVGVRHEVVVFKY